MKNSMVSKMIFLCMLMWPMITVAAEAADVIYGVTTDRAELGRATGDGNRYSASRTDLVAVVRDNQLVDLKMDNNTSCRLVLSPNPVAMKKMVSIIGATSGPCMIMHMVTVQPEKHGDQLWLQFKNGHLVLTPVAASGR